MSGILSLSLSGKTVSLASFDIMSSEQNSVAFLTTTLKSVPSIICVTLSILSVSLKAPE